MKYVRAAIICALLFVPLTRSLHAAEIDYDFVSVTSNQTTTSSTYGTITGATIADTEFTATKKYLLFITAQCVNTTGTAGVMARIKVIHGSTDFTESIAEYSEGAGNRFNYLFFTVWTAVSSEAISVQFASENNSDTIGCDQVGMFKLNLTDNLTENTDWFFNERTNDDSLSTTPTDGGSLTFTPAAGDWAVLTYAVYSTTGNTDSTTSIMDRSGEATSSTPSQTIDVTNSDNNIQAMLARVFALTAVSNTFKEISSISGATDTVTRTHSSVFALNLNKFRNHTNAYTDADASLSATDYATNAQTASITPDIQGAVWVVAGLGFDKQNTARKLEFRLQIDDADDPAAQTTDNYPFDLGAGASDESYFIVQTVSTLTAAAHTLDLDASADSISSTPAVQHRTIFAVTMELPASPATARPVVPIIMQ